MSDGDKTRNLITFAQSTLYALKQTFDVPYAALVRQRDKDGIAVYRLMLRDLEAARLCVSPQKGHMHDDDFVELLESLLSMSGNPAYLPNLRSLRITRSADHDGHHDDTALVVIERLINRINIHLEVSGIPLPSERLLRLKSIIPAQKIAPVQFEIRHDKISIKDSASEGPAERRKIISSAQDELLHTGNEVLGELAISNCDRRLLSRVQHLQSHLAGRVDAVRAGLIALSCEMMSSTLEHELPPAVFSMLNAYTRGVHLFLGQFPEWNDFVENATAASLDSSDVLSLQNATSKLIDLLTEHPDQVDPEVPKTLAFLNELIASPTRATKRAAFAVLRSAENLISAIFGYGLDFASKTASKVLEATSSAASRAIVATLLAIAVSGAASIGPIAARLPDMQWIKTATDIMKKEIEYYRSNR